MTICKTGMGQQVLKDRSVPLTPRQRAALILLDGRRSVDQVLATSGGAGVTREDIDSLLDLGLAEDSVLEGSPASPPPLLPPDARSDQERYAAAYPVAIRLTAGLGLRGFRLNLAVEGAGSLEDLAALAPKIREAVGEAKFAELRRALGQRDH